MNSLAAALAATGRHFGAVLLLLLLAALAPAFAQQGEPPSQTGGGTGASGEESASELSAELGVTAEQAQDLLEVLQDEEARTQLIERLQGLIALQGEETDQVTQLEESATDFLEQEADFALRRLRQMARSFESVLRVVPDLTSLLGSAEALERFTRAVVEAAVFGAVLGLVAWLTNRAVGRLRRRLSDVASRSSLPRKLLLALAKLLVDALPLAAMAIVFGIAVVAGLLDYLTEMGGLFSLYVLTTLILLSVVGILARALLAPSAPGLRFVRASDERARYLFGWTLTITHTFLWGKLAAEALFAYGASYAVRTGILVLVTLAATLLAVFFVHRNRRYITAAIWQGRREGETLQGARRWFAKYWHILAYLYILLFILVACANFDEGFDFMLIGSLLTAVILAVSKLVRTIIDWAARRQDRRSEDKGRIGSLLIGVARALANILTVVFLLQVWGINVFGLLGGEFGAQAGRTAIAIAVLLVIAFLIWKVVTGLLERQLASSEASDRPARRGARMRTLVPLLRNGLMVILVTVVGLMVLAELGIDIGPLLAGAGIAGLAIGFGAQTLVQDIITGLFIILEDQIQIGDVVDTGGHAGVVEGMTIRTLRLRDLKGTVHVVPFSQVAAVQNMTKDFSYYLLDVGVAYREDVDKVIEELRDLGRELREDPNYGPLMLADIEIMGLDQFADSAVVVRARLKTLPIQQWTVGREFNRRMKRRFDEKGIEIPFPHMTVYWGVDKEGKAPPAFLEVNARTEEVQAAVAEGAEEAAAEEPKKAPKRRRKKSKTDQQRGDEEPQTQSGADD